MNVWDWVVDLEEKLEAEGQDRLVEVIGGVSQAVHDDEYARVDAYVAEGVAAARAMNMPWLEVYFRHWDLQSRVLDRCHGEIALKDTVELFELAHRDENLGCPQRVCATQDLAHVWGSVDGPGYAEERLAVTGETLGAITPDWNCWNCISVEHADALLDAGRPAEVIPWIELQQKARRAAGEDAEDQRYFDQRVEALLALGRTEEALALLEGLTEEELTEARESERLRWRLIKARCLAKLDRAQEAAATLPDFSELGQLPGTWSATAETLRVLLERGALTPTFELFGSLRLIYDRLTEVGSLRRSFEVGALLAELSMALAAPTVAAHLLRRMEALVPRLKSQAAPLARLAAIASRLKDAPKIAASSLEVPPAELDHQAPLEAYERCAALLEAGAQDASLHIRHAELLFALRFRAEAIAALSTFAEQHAAVEAVTCLGWMASQAGDEAALERAVARARALGEPLVADWLRARHWIAAGRRAEAEALLERILAADPDAKNTRRLLMEQRKEQGAWEAVRTHALYLIAKDEADRDARWNLCLASTILGRWEEVRAQASALGMDFPGEGEINGEGPIIRLAFPDGPPRGVHAMRSGPVTARVIEFPEADDPFQVQGDVAVFDPSPLEHPDPEDPHSTFLFPVLKTLRSADRRTVASFIANPSPALLSAMSQHLEARGGETLEQAPRGPWRRPGGAEVSVFRVMLAVPRVITDQALASWLEELRQTHGADMVWPDLAAAVGRPEPEREEAFFARESGD
ncbi:MAG: hypothetical protein U1E65_07110 [Myxococcota bacterium]